LIGENIELQWKRADNLWLVKMDPTQIDLILANLCVNSKDAIADMGTITIETSNCTLNQEFCIDHVDFIQGEYVRLAVIDNGCGMEKEVLDHIFEPFFTTKETGRGTGLGLATVYGAVKQNNGLVEVNSTPGIGTTIAIYLPRNVEGRQHHEKKEAPLHRGQETILLVEDEPAILRVATSVLKNLGYTTLTASTPHEAIRIAGDYKGHIHLLITDVIMPEMNGRNLADKLLSLHTEMKCLFMSGYTADIIARQGAIDERVHFIQKPFSLEDLDEKLREVLGGIK
jgi:two-component system, cell cycle sensor histidine kinase and response regulator CckA